MTSPAPAIAACGLSILVVALSSQAAAKTISSTHWPIVVEFSDGDELQHHLLRALARPFGDARLKRAQPVAQRMIDLCCAQRAFNSSSTEADAF